MRRGRQAPGDEQVLLVLDYLVLDLLAGIFPEVDHMGGLPVIPRDDGISDKPGAFCFRQVADDILHHPRNVLQEIIIRIIRH